MYLSFHFFFFLLVNDDPRATSNKASKKADYEANAPGSTLFAVVDVNDHEHLGDSLALLRSLKLTVFYHPKSRF